MQIKKIQTIKDHDFVRLQQEYESEFAVITGYKPDENGIFDQEFLTSTWSKFGYDIYLLESNHQIAGFAVVNLSSMISDDNNVRDIAEFFIIPNLRNNNLGTLFAQKIFYQYPGNWEVRQLPSLIRARKFWIRAIQSCKYENYQEQIDHPNWVGFVQKFKIVTTEYDII